MLAYILMNSFWKWFRKDKYKGVRFTTKNIAYITMLSSVSVVATIIVSITIPITVLPPIRIAFEGLMIKITGYMFGPIIGIICAAVTDILVMLFVPSYISIYYMFCIIFTGFLAGIAGIFKVKLKDYPWVIFALINFFIIFFAGGGMYIVISGKQSSYSMSGIIVNKYVLASIMGGGGIIGLLSIYSVLFYYLLKKEIYRIKEILPIILLVVVAEYVTTVLIAAYADMTLFDPNAKDYGATAIMRIVQAPFKIIINSIIIYVTWRTVNPLINIDNNNY
ncbi:Substrate-specific component FolT of folate ECF transporter [Spiroplasma endosymbiont of Danaus chrysippus]|nr:Substrate-specific component FolT of folate ECF transporter [Spiroplasma endosymbiont of Danaus chrysippus]